MDFSVYLVLQDSPPSSMMIHAMSARKEVIVTLEVYVNCVPPELLDLVLDYPVVFCVKLDHLVMYLVRNYVLFAPLALLVL